MVVEIETTMIDAAVGVAAAAVGPMKIVVAVVVEEVIAVALFVIPRDDSRKYYSLYLLLLQRQDRKHACSSFPTRDAAAVVAPVTSTFCLEAATSQQKVRVV